MFNFRSIDGASRNSCLYFSVSNRQFVEYADVVGTLTKVRQILLITEAYADRNDLALGAEQQINVGKLIEVDSISASCVFSVARAYYSRRQK